MKKQVIPALLLLMGMLSSLGVFLFAFPFWDAVLWMRKMRYDANTAWKAALRRAGIDDFRFHDLRHTWASWLVQAGVPLSVLQEMGGWESIEMVRRYAHLAPNHLTEHARQIDSILNPSVPNLSQSKNKEGTNDV